MTDHYCTDLLDQLRGVIGREPSGADRFIFPFDSVRTRGVHMVGVRRPLRVTFFDENGVTKQTVLRPWVGYASARANLIVEEPATEAAI